MKYSVFDIFHPLVAFTYFAIFLVISMAAMQPIYLILSYSAALLYSAVLSGVQRAALNFLVSLFFVAVLAGANLVFSASGSTELFWVGTRAFYGESLVYGAFMGVMLSSVLLIFSNASTVLTTDKVMALFGNVLPTIGLMISMVMRLLPQFIRRGRDIEAVEKACTSARLAVTVSSKERSTRAVRFRGYLRQLSVLMGWSMEDSLDMADAMKARGFGVGELRTTYARFRFNSTDAAALVVVGLLACSSALMAWIACSDFSFYPTLVGLSPWWTYVSYGVFLALPFGAEVRERLIWKS